LPKRIFRKGSIPCGVGIMYLKQKLEEAYEIIKSLEKQNKVYWKSVIQKQGKRISQLEKRIEELEGKQKQKRYLLLSSLTKEPNPKNLADKKVIKVPVDLFLIMLTKRLTTNLIVVLTVAASLARSSNKEVGMLKTLSQSRTTELQNIIFQDIGVLIARR